MFLGRGCPHPRSFFCAGEDTRAPKSASYDRPILKNGLLVVVTSLIATVGSSQTSDADKPLEQTKKSIKVLTGVPTSQLIPIMTVMANSIGVTCNYCHVAGDFASDEKPQKEAGRRMIRLVRTINDAHYGGRAVVTCNTCHRGDVATVDVPSVI